MKCTPRSTLVTVKMDKAPKIRKSGLIILVGDAEQYGTGTILGVGPGCVLASGAVPETHDLEVGMKVLIKDKKLGRNQNTGRAELQSEGLPLHKALAGEEDVVLFDQSNIIMILEGEIPAEFSEEALKDDRLETKAKTGPIGLITRG